jgi:hypothetical protein
VHQILEQVRLVEAALTASAPMVRVLPAHLSAKVPTEMAPAPAFEQTQIRQPTQRRAEPKVERFS